MFLQLSFWHAMRTVLSHKSDAKHTQLKAGMFHPLIMCLLFGHKCKTCVDVLAGHYWSNPAHCFGYISAAVFNQEGSSIAFKYHASLCSPTLLHHNQTYAPCLLFSGLFLSYRGDVCPCLGRCCYCSQNADPAARQAIAYLRACQEQNALCCTSQCHSSLQTCISGFDSTCTCLVQS